MDLQIYGGATARPLSRLIAARDGAFAWAFRLSGKMTRLFVQLLIYIGPECNPRLKFCPAWSAVLIWPFRLPMWKKKSRPSSSALPAPLKFRVFVQEKHRFP